MTIGTGFMRVHWEYADVTINGFLINHLMCKNKNKYKKWNLYEKNLVINIKEVKRK